MTRPGWLARIGPRNNVSPANNASWLMALGILALAIPASDTVAANEVFFAAHGVPSLAWVVLLAAVIVLGWLVLFGILWTLRRFASATAYDAVASAITLVVAWFLVGNVLARTLLSGLPWLGLVGGLTAAVILTLLARRLAMGTILVVFAGVAAAAPLVISAVSTGDQSAEGGFAWDATTDRPSVLWIVSDELQYPLAQTQDGEVRGEFPNLRALQADSTTYTRAYTAANYTDYAVPSMLAGISDAAAQGTERMQDVRAGTGIIPALAAEYSVVMESPIYSFECDSADCASVGSGSDVGRVERYAAFAKDTSRHRGQDGAGRPLLGLLPVSGRQVARLLGGRRRVRRQRRGGLRCCDDRRYRRGDEVDPDTPFLAFWHTIRTHAPWVVDRDGRQIYPSRVPIVDGAHMIGAEADQTYTTEELKSLQRRLYANSAVDFDRQLGLLLDDLKATGRYDDTMIIVTADHGATMTERSDRRVGDDLVQRWSEVAHVPLLVKYPGQQDPAVVSEPRSTGQIAATVTRAAGATPSPDLGLSPDLSTEVPGGPVFTTVAGGVMTPWPYTGIDEVDPWRPEDLAPPDPAYPFAIGVDEALLGGPVPSGWVAVPDPGLQSLPGDSPQQVLIVDRPTGACADDSTVGLVSSDGTVIGTVLWEGPEGSTTDRTRGWAIVPRSESGGYAVWCPAG